MKGRFTTLTLATAAMMIVGCSKSADSFSLLSDGSSFTQNAVYVPRKVDILWVIDNSGSMDSSQTALANNFSSFIAKFTASDSDFHMAVTTTDAYLAPYYNDTTRSRIRDGAGSSHSGIFVMDKNTPNLNSVFLTNVKQGIGGSGDERAFSSFKETLNNSWNAGFRRADAFLAVIIVSDEDDFSHNDFTTGLNGYYFTEDYNDPKMYSVQSYVDFLTSYTAPAGSGKNFSVNTISIQDTACRDFLNQSSSGRKVGTRYINIATLTGGQQISLCSDFSQSLQLLSQSIVELSSVFNLGRAAIESTIVVKVNGNVVAKDANNGWTYDAVNYAIAFHGSSIPAAGADVKIAYDPATVKN